MKTIFNAIKMGLAGVVLFAMGTVWFFSLRSLPNDPLLEHTLALTRTLNNVIIFCTLLLGVELVVEYFYFRKDKR